MRELQNFHDILGGLCKDHGLRQGGGVPLVGCVDSEDFRGNGDLGSAQELDKGIVHGSNKGHFGARATGFFCQHLTFPWESEA